MSWQNYNSRWQKHFYLHCIIILLSMYNSIYLYMTHKVKYANKICNKTDKVGWNGICFSKNKRKWLESGWCLYLCKCLWNLVQASGLLKTGLGDYQRGHCMYVSWGTFGQIKISLLFVTFHWMPIDIKKITFLYVP